MGHYSGGTLNDTGAMRKRLRTLDRRLTAAVTASGSQPNQTTDKVNSINVNVQSALDAANAAQTTASQASTDATAARTAASDAQSNVTVLTSQLAASTVFYTRIWSSGNGETALYQLSIPAAPGANPHGLALVTVSVVGAIVFASPDAPQLEIRYIDYETHDTESITWMPPVVDDAGTYPGVPGLVTRDVNMSCSLYAEGNSNVLLFFLPVDTNGGPRPYFSIRVDYPPAAPTAASLMAAKPADDGPTMPELPPGFELDATASQSTDTKEQSS